MSSKSKNKGNSWEREVASYLSSLYSESFIRVPNSGAYVGGRHSVRKQILHQGQIRMMKGDIIPPTTWTYFNVECKSYADFIFHSLFTNECKLLDTWIEQTLDAADSDDINLVLFKITRKGKFVAVPDLKIWDTSNSFVKYNSKKFNSWIIYDFDYFWSQHKEIVKNLSLLGIKSIDK